MIFRHFKPAFPKLIFFVLACTLPLTATSTMDDAISEKRIGVAMRIIGHEVLKCLGDSESRVMPIEKIDDQYKIPFEFDFGFDPEDIVAIVERVMTGSGIANDYLVEVEQCETKEVVHSFEIRNAANSVLIPCRGRVLPKDCYHILITILHGKSTDTNLLATTADSLSIQLGAPSETKKANLFKSTFLLVPLLILIGLIGFLIKKKNPVDIDPNLILIGAYQFDKRNMSLAFEKNRVELSNKESELLSLLHTSANEPVKRDVILQKVWGDEGDYVGRTLDVFISKLRKKLEADASVRIVNIRGIGYKLVLDFPG